MTRWRSLSTGYSEARLFPTIIDYWYVREHVYAELSSKYKLTYLLSPVKPCGRSCAKLSVCCRCHAIERALMLPRLCWVALCWGGEGGGSLPFYTNDVVSWKFSVCSSLRLYRCSTIAIFIHCKVIVFCSDLIPQGQGSSELLGNLTLCAYVCALAFPFTGSSDISEGREDSPQDNELSSNAAAIQGSQTSAPPSSRLIDTTGHIRRS